MRVVSKSKLEDIRKRMCEKKVDALLLLNSAPIHDSTIEYITGFRQERNQAFSCLIFSRKKTALIVSALDYDQACLEAEADEIIQIKKSRFGNVLKDNLGGAKMLGICESIFPVSMKRILKKKTMDFEKELLGIRSIKEKREIDLIEKSCSISNRGISFLEKNMSSFRTCKEIAIELERFVLRSGADEMAFPTLVTTGKRGLWIHPYPPASKDKLGNIGLVDFGARLDGYCSDVTVPFVKGEPGKIGKKIIKTVEEAYKVAAGSIEAGAKASEIFEKARSAITKKGFEFKHSLGHGIGLDVHEYPNLSPMPIDKKLIKKWKDTELKENMVFTIEPGIYEKLGGFRIENDFLLSAKGPKQLTKSRMLEI